MGKSKPRPPDYAGAARAEGEASKEITMQQTYANRPTQYSPYGQVDWETGTAIDPATGKPVTTWTQRETLSPELQKIYDQQLALQAGRSGLGAGMIGRVAEEFGEQMDWTKFGDPTAIDPQARMQDPEMWRQQAFENQMQMATSRLDPQFEQEQQRLEIQLANQGLTAGDEAYDNAMANFNRRKTDAYNQAMMGAQATAGQEAQRMQEMERQQLGYGADLTFREADYANKLRQEAIKEDMTRRGFSLNEINALLYGQQVQNPQFEGFAQATKSQTPQLLQAATQQGNFDQMAAQGFMGGLGSILGAGIQGLGMFCDRRLKENICQIGFYMGYPLYEFDYIWGVHGVGVMSDEVNKEAVVKHHTGYDMVDYSKIKEQV